MTRYGIAELFGEDISSLAPEKRSEMIRTGHKSIACRFSGGTCSKKGGVCSLRLYGNPDDNGIATPLSPDSVTAVCPRRFHEDGTVIRWIAQTILSDPNPKIVNELPFLIESNSETGEAEADAVGRIDSVLVHSESPLNWCAVEHQAVYFSGEKMQSQFEALSSFPFTGHPFPDKIRRPDFRSSGPKRLMPQLQIKVPTLRRWGKKMAVVVDAAFWNNLGAMRCVNDVSNADILWFVVTYKNDSSGKLKIDRHECYMTQLEHAVEGLTGGRPISQSVFEEKIRKKLSKTN